MKSPKVALFRDLRNLRPRSYLKVGLIVLWVFSLVGLALGDYYGSLPARHWNPSNLIKIKAKKANALSFAVFGDSRNSRGVFEQLLRQVDHDPDLAFAIHLGDLVQDADLKKYRFFFRQIQEHLKLPLLTVMGNHELHGTHGKELHHHIFGPDYYAFQINGHYFVVIDDAAKDGPDERQLRWLTEELRKAQAYQTRLVFLHIPLFDPRGGDHHHCLPEKMGRRLANLFQKYHVTHIFTGHIHSYFTGHWSGVPYTITAGAGAELYGTDPEHYFFHYLKVTLRGAQVQIEVQRVKGRTWETEAWERKGTNVPSFSPVNWLTFSPPWLKPTL